MNTNKWNKIRYSIHSIYYDLLLLLFKKERERAIRILNPTEGKSILIIGAGTGLDLPYLEGDFDITATDITPSMLKKLKRRARRLNLNVKVSEMDGQNLRFEDNTFDYVILNLILAVIPDPEKCIREAERVLKQNGSVLVFDKFLNDNKEPSLCRNVLNIVTSFIFSDINRKFSDMLSVTNLQIEAEQSSKMSDQYKIYILENKKQYGKL